MPESSPPSCNIRKVRCPWDEFAQDHKWPITHNIYVYPAFSIPKIWPTVDSDSEAFSNNSKSGTYTMLLFNRGLSKVFWHFSSNFLLLPKTQIVNSSKYAIWKGDFCVILAKDQAISNIISKPLYQMFQMKHYFFTTTPHRQKLIAN